MKKLLLVGALLTLGGCASMNPMSDNGMVEIKEENAVPEWYVNPQSGNEAIVYGAGTAVSEDLQFALDKAMHQAKIDLGDKLSAIVSSEMKSTISDGAIGTIQENSKVAKSGYKNVDVSKYKVINKVVFKEEERFRTYVLLKLNRADAVIGSQQETQEELDNL